MYFKGRSFDDSERFEGLSLVLITHKKLPSGVRCQAVKRRGVGSGEAQTRLSRGGEN